MESQAGSPKSTNKVGGSFENDVKKLNKTRHVRKIVEVFLRMAKKLDDPRTRHCEYPLNEILFIAIVAVLCGADSYSDFETFDSKLVESLDIKGRLVTIDAGGCYVEIVG